jgi:hypothetical protein
MKTALLTSRPERERARNTPELSRVRLRMASPDSFAGRSRSREISGVRNRSRSRETSGGGTGGEGKGDVTAFQVVCEAGRR